jgi:hypothetical protein
MFSIAYKYILKFLLTISLNMTRASTGCFQILCLKSAKKVMQARKKYSQSNIMPSTALMKSVVILLTAMSHSIISNLTHVTRIVTIFVSV